jgi:hypothetical protein
MNYSEIDPIIESWALSNNLNLLKSYQDTEVRSVELVNQKGERYQIWVELLEEQVVKVFAWDYKKHLLEVETNKNGLLKQLNHVLAMVHKWM